MTRDDLSDFGRRYQEIMDRGDEFDMKAGELFGRAVEEQWTGRRYVQEYNAMLVEVGYRKPDDPMDPLRFQFPDEQDLDRPLISREEIERRRALKSASPPAAST